MAWRLTRWSRKPIFPPRQLWPQLYCLIQSNQPDNKSCFISRRQHHENQCIIHTARCNIWCGGIGLKLWSNRNMAHITQSQGHPPTPQQDWAKAPRGSVLLLLTPLVDVWSMVLPYDLDHVDDHYISWATGLLNMCEACINVKYWSLCTNICIYHCNIKWKILPLPCCCVNYIIIIVIITSSSS